MKVGCVVVAAGKGTRAGLGRNKAFYALGGVSLLWHTLHALDSSGRISEFALVLSREDEPVFAAEAGRLGPLSCPMRIARGGATRRESAHSGLKALSPDTDIVLIHDAARPYVTKEIIETVIADAEKYGSGVICCPVTDTVKRVNGTGEGVETLDRAALRAVQTPQAFSYQKILRAHGEWPEDPAVTDDAYLYEKLYGSVHLTEAPTAAQNIKLTTREDFMRAEERYVPEYRVGTGYDVHRLVEGRRLILCGVDIPHEKGLLGHSDADVALHALMDAMLGAAALGDIGKLFPDTDDRYKGISSLKLLKATDRVIGDKGWQVANCDITVVCQKPKLAPYIPKMRENIADTLCVPVDCISVKATTTEHLGFEGEMLGISAQAVTSLRRKK